MAHVELENVSRHFGPVRAIDDVSLGIEKGEFCALLGPSGCGKSTLLRVIAGLEVASAGKVRINDVDITGTPPAKRRIAMVFQSYALYPHMSVRQNISFGLEMAREPKEKIAQKVDSVAQMLQLGEFLDRRPAQLSGGQRQRVAIGRALVRDPEVFLFDEPLSNLDAMLRVQMRVELANLHQTLGTTMIYVTHDQVEAMTLADRIVVLDRGRISQSGTPLDLYHRPANKFVASFIGSPAMNFLPITPRSETREEFVVQLPGGSEIKVPKRIAEASSPPIEIGVRPEHIAVGSASDGVRGNVFMVEHLGNSTIIHVQTDGGALVAQQDGDSSVKVGENVSLSLSPERLHLFGSDARIV
jgi:multiple sugar transport system ATP-binding protein